MVVAFVTSQVAPVLVREYGLEQGDTVALAVYARQLGWICLRMVVEQPTHSDFDEEWGDFDGDTFGVA